MPNLAQGFFHSGILLSACIFSGQVLAHASVLAKDVNDQYDGRNYREGSSAMLNLHLAHGCSDANTGETFATRHAVTILPNNQDLSGIAYTENHDGERFHGNALMGVKAAVDNNWKKIKQLKGSVPEFENHGAKNSDVRAIHWLGGRVPNDMYANLQFKANLPMLDGCVSQLRVYLPTIQYCEKGRVKAWFREATPSMPAEVISPGYAPSLTIVRDEDRNPLPNHCAGVGVSEEVYPSPEDLEKHLLKRRRHSMRHDD